SSHAYQVPLCAVSPAPLGLMTPAVEVHGAAEPVSKPGLPSNCDAVQPPLELIVQVKLADPEALVVSFAVTVTLKVPAALGVPGVIQAHLSPFSAPLESVQPPGGFWSVMVSAYSCPLTMDTPSRVPLLLTKFWPQEAPMSVMYGLLVNAMSPYGELTAPPLSVVSPFQSCQAQNWPDGVLYPSGWVLCGDTMMYWAVRLSAAVVLPKWAAAL